MVTIEERKIYQAFLMCDLIFPLIMKPYTNGLYKFMHSSALIDPDEIYSRSPVISL